MSFRESLELARDHAKLRKVGFHDLRHHFISYCVMSGIDYMTIAKWVGYKDGGILIGKVYGHLAETYTRDQAQRVNFAPQPKADKVAEPKARKQVRGGKDISEPVAVENATKHGHQ